MSKTNNDETIKPSVPQEKEVERLKESPDIPKGIFTKKIPFIQAKHYTNLSGEKTSRNPRVIVIHSMEAPEKGNTAENVAKYFSHMSDGRVASAHYCIDADSIVQCVQMRDVAYGAKGMNRHGIHLELAGYAAQTPQDWVDGYSKTMLHIAAKLCATVIVPKYNIDIKWLTSPEIVRVASDKTVTGFVTHAMVSNALKIKGGHQDPGKGFPMNLFLDLVRRYSPR